jgi:hypothetical protein
MDVEGSAAALASLAALPGIKPWMLEAAECAAQRQSGLSPDEWCERLADLVATSLNGVESIAADPVNRDGLTLSPEYLVDATDVQAYALASSKAVAELIALLRSMRIRPTRVQPATVRLVVDNTRPKARPGAI